MKTKILLILIVVLQMILSGCDKNSVVDEYALKINGVEISKAEVYTYLYETFNGFETVGGSDIWDTDFDGQTAEAVAIENTLNSIKTIKLTVERANRLDVGLSNEEKAAAAKEAEDFYKTLSDDVKTKTGIDMDTLEIAMREKMLYAKVYTEITENYVTSEADFESYFENQKPVYKNYYTILTLKNIFTDKKEDADYVASMLENGGNFEDLYNDYNNIDLNPQGNIAHEVYKSSFETYIKMSEEIAVGDVVGPVEVAEGYFVNLVEMVEEPAEEDIRTLCRADYEQSMKQRVFAQEYSLWEASAEVKKNNEVWDSIAVKGIFN